MVEVISGVMRFTGIAIAEVSIDKREPTLKMTAKAAFVDPRTGDTHGWTTGGQWSPATIEKMGELIALMENDLAIKHLEGAGSSPSTGVAVARPGISGGLGEHLAGRDGDSI